MLAVLELFDGVTAPALPAGWTQTTTSSNAWATVANQSDTAPNHAFVANPANISESILTSPSFLLPSATPRLSFRNNFSTEATWDGGVFEISINGGAFADILTAGGSFVSGGYVSALNSSGAGNTNPLAGRQAWHGSSSGYISTVVNMPATSLNQNVSVRWRFGSDGSIGDTGWRVDTVTLDSVPTDDFGDAPTSYPVTLAENGARHTVGSLFLGTQVDAELDGAHSSDASADGADEDGVVFQGSLLRGGSQAVQVTASQAGLLNAWVDWNADGDWTDSGEQIFVNQALTAGANSLTVSIPLTAVVGNTYARFRISTASGLSFTGAATNGEVEDYRLAVSNPGPWTPLGPFGATNGQVEGIANRPVVGAIHTVLAHPTNADILYVGAVNGGVWKTTNATSSQPNWTPLTDSMSSLSIGALSFDLSDPTFNTVYAGIGQYSSFGRLGNTRIGLIRTTDGGQNWQVVNGGGVLQGKNISGIFANGSTVVVSVNVADAFTFSNIGIFRSTNGGTSFTQISTGNGAATGLPGGVSYDLVFDPITPTTLYTSTVFSDSVGGVNGVYKSTNSGANWTKVSTPAMDALITNNTSNLELAVGRSNEVYAAIINSGAFAGLFRSPNGGGSWTQMDSPRTNENGTDVGLNPSGGKGPSNGVPEDVAGGQGAIHFSIVADPTNANIVYVGGDRQPRTFGDTGSFPNSIGANDFSGRLFRGNASLATGSQFVHLTHRNDLGAVGGGTASNSSPHADSREMTFDANGNIIEVDDGGIYRRTSPQTNTGDWFSVIGDLQVTEAHDAAWDSLSNVAITGNQDTGTTFQPSENATQWVSVSTADGGDVAVDNIQLAGSNQSVRYSSFQNLGSFRRTVWNAAGGLVSTTFPALTPTSGSAAISRTFRNPIETNNVAGGRLLIQGSNGLYESLDAGSTVTSIGVGVGSNSITSNALWYGGTQNNVANPNLVWAASNTNVFVRTSGTGNVVATAADPTTAEIRDLAVNSRDWANAFVIDDNQVFQTVNVGASWSDITGNLLSLASSLRSITYIAGAVTNSIVVGTNLGVFASTTTALGTWFRVGGGLPNVIAYDLDYDSTDDVLVVGTMGRGAWSLRNASIVAAGIATPIVTITSTNKVYDNTVYVATASITGTNLNAPIPALSFVFYADSSGTTIISAPENAGTYFVRAFTATNVGNNPAQSVITQFQITPFALTASATAANKIYDGNTNAVVAISLTGVFAGDTVNGSATGTFNNKNVGTVKPVTVGAITLAGADAGNYTVGTAANPTADIQPRVLTPTATATNKVYDGNTAATVTISLAGVVGSEVVTGAAAGTFDNKNVGNGKVVTVSTVTLSGADAGNYTASSAASTTANVTPKLLVGTITVLNKVFDGTTSATIGTRSLSGVIGGDTVSYVGGTAVFPSPAVGTYTVPATGLSLSGADAGNYTVNTTASATASITPANGPTVASVGMNGGDTYLNANQRSQLTSVVVTFNTAVTLTSGALRIFNANTNVEVTSLIVTPNATASQFTIRFASGTGVQTRPAGNGNSLVDGNYKLVVDATKVAAGSTNMAANYEFGNAATDRFFRLFGDSDGDGDVDGTDTTSFRRSFLGLEYSPAMDWDGDGVVLNDTQDVAAYNANRNKVRSPLP
jgi:hypothetical protein